MDYSTSNFAVSRSRRSIDLHELGELIASSRPGQEMSLSRLDKIVKKSLVVVSGYGKNPNPNSKRKRRLVSFGYATGDGVMISCIEKIYIHPECTDERVKETTLKMLKEYLAGLGVEEVYTIVKDAEESLFTFHGFGNDVENSILMTIPSNCAIRIEKHF